MWIQLPNLKLNLWSSSGISKIASTVGIAITTDKLTATRERLSYARVLIEIKLPLKEPLPNQIVVQGPDGKCYNQKIVYELKPRWCKNCNIVGHMTKQCRRQILKKVWVPKQQVTSALASGEHANNMQEKANGSVKELNIHAQTVKEQIQEPITTQDSAGKENGNSGKNLPHKHAPTVTSSGEVSVHVSRSNYMGLANITSPTINVSGFSSVNRENAAKRVNIGDKANLASSYIQASQFSLLNCQVHDLDPSNLDRALLETKVAGNKMQWIAGRMVKNWSWYSNSQQANKGRSWILWDNGMLSIQCISSSDQFISCYVNSKDGKLSCIITVVYAMNNLEDRKKLWHDLLSFKQNVTCPWIIGGDFNAIINNEEKLGGTLVSDYDTEDFINFISICQLTYLNYCQVDYLAPNCSDHSPGLITIGEDDFKGKRPFKFFSMWINHPDFTSVVKTVWEQDVRGFHMYKLHTKLRKLKQNLKVLNKKHFMNISEQVIRAKCELTDTQNQLNNHPFNQMLISKEKECLIKYTRLIDCETSFYKQKANIRWDLYGDKCSQFFHSIMKAKRHHNRVLSLHTENGERITDMADIATEFTEYYKRLLGVATHTSTPDPGVISSGPILSPAQSNSLVLPVSRKEIKNAVFFMSSERAPGPDGYNASFFKAAWEIISEDIHNPKTPSDFRPISCCNCVYKIISKIIASRIQEVLGLLIGEGQSAFVRGKSISSNILLAHELVKHYVRKQTSPRATLNIDQRKAFDTISWSFIESMLSGLGFPNRMIIWIMECITSTKFSLSLNGTLHGYFRGARGLRQGDPLSPYLFFLGMEYLSRRLNTLKNDSLFKHHPKCSKLNITHIFFADDLLLFGKANIYSIAKLYDCLQEFSQVSGLEVNPNKCSVYFSGIDDRLKQQICTVLNFLEGVLPVRYLGMPLISKRLSSLECSPLINKITDQFQRWQKSKNLSYAGRL
ncbi:uncharacterized protein LOC109831820 [Asparagus officinalis]|uniref:uncharacterized protein LOC109831820 n=1 Tax=Asparagus officinalis TaxID=4686 RepID=UPI00098E1039|nr:uncharacterized protein LOC109831820 [Asparagus officinalis]